MTAAGRTIHTKLQITLVVMCMVFYIIDTTIPIGLYYNRNW